MTTVIINERTKEGKALIEILQKMESAKIITAEPNSTTVAAMQDVLKGKTHKADDVKDLMKDIGYAPSTSLDEGIGRFVEWYLEYYGR